MSGHGIIKTLSKPVNISILALLSTGPKYPRALARLLGKSEAFIVRNLKELEREGLVESYWVHTAGKNVKMYRLKTQRIVISFSTGSVKAVAEDGSEKILLSRGYSDPVPDPGLFVDRIREIELLRSTRGVSFVWGPMGMGKSSLAAVVARAYDAKLWINCTQLTLPDEVVRRISLFLADQGLPVPGHLAARSPLDAVAAIAERLDALEALVVLDDFHKPLEKHGLYELLERLDEALSESSVLVLSREPPEMIPSKGILLPLQPLPLEAAEALIEMMGLNVDEEAARWVYDASAGNPGILTAMLKLLAAGYKPEEIAGGGLLDGILSKILESLDPYERRVLAAASVFLAPPTVEEVAEVSGVSRAEVYISRLASKGVVRVAEGRVVVHDAVKGYVERREPRRAAHYHRVLARRLLERGSRDDMFRAVYHYVRAGDYREAIDLLEKYGGMGLLVPSYYREIFFDLIDSMEHTSLDPYYRLLLEYHRAAALGHEEAARLFALIAAEAEERGYTGLAARAYAAAAHEAFTLGTEYSGYLDKALSLSARVEEGGVDTKYYIYLIRVLHRSGRLAEALKHAHRYLTLAREPHDRAYAHHFLAVLYEALWEPEEALRHMDLAIESYRETPILSNLATALDDKGFLLYRLGRLEEARRSLEEAAAIAATCGDTYAQTLIEMDLAELEIDSGNLGAAAERLEKVKRELGGQLDASPYLRALYMLVEARVLAASGKLGEADKGFEAACSALEGLHRYHYARCLLYHAFLLANIDRGRACRMLRRAVEAYRGMGNDRLASEAEARLAELCGGG